MTRPPSRPRRRRPITRAALALCAAIALAVAGWAAYRYHGPSAPVEIYRGITYGCDRLPDTDQGGGLVHWVRADLNVPGVRLYVTPTDRDAQAAGWEYKLRHVSTAVSNDGLAVAVNGALFASDSRFVHLPGDFARSTETVVANGVPNHVDPQTYLLWWDADQLAHIEMSKPPSPAVLRRAVWGIGGQQVVVVGGAVGGWVGPGNVDWRTAIGADPDRRLVWIACFDHASYLTAGRELVRLGAKVGLLVDGGTSMAMALGRDARGVRSGTVTGNWRPVATQFGFRAEPLP